MAAALWVAVLIGIAGCGGETDRRSSSAREISPGEVAKRYLRAFAAGDGGDACKYFTRDLRRYFLSRAVEKPSSCAEAIRNRSAAAPSGALATLRDVRVKTVTVRGSVATVHPTGDPRYEAPGGPRPLRLRRTEGRWRIALLPGLGPPREVAQVCVEEGLRNFDDRKVAPFWRRAGRAAFRDYLALLCPRISSTGKIEPANARVAREVIRQMVREGRLKVSR